MSEQMSPEIKSMITARRERRGTIFGKNRHVQAAGRILTRKVAEEIVTMVRTAVKERKAIDDPAEQLHKLVRSDGRPIYLREKPRDPRFVPADEYEDALVNISNFNVEPPRLRKIKGLPIGRYAVYDSLLVNPQMQVKLHRQIHGQPLFQRQELNESMTEDATHHEAEIALEGLTDALFNTPLQQSSTTPKP